MLHLAKFWMLILSGSAEEEKLKSNGSRNNPTENKGGGERKGKREGKRRRKGSDAACAMSLGKPPRGDGTRDPECLPWVRVNQPLTALIIIVNNLLNNDEK
ncbi:Ribonucleases P/Mrp Protein Subunit Pop1 [Manis pentadactyla]|nr:Ribonucleases P/Mrp Protein Subunit Pop1 [Manis pentadactyla]